MSEPATIKTFFTTLVRRALPIGRANSSARFSSEHVMQSWIGSSIVMLLVMLAFFGTQPAHAAAEPGSWRVVQSVGEVAVIGKDAPSGKPKPGTLLPPGAIVTTGSNGRAILSREGQQIVLQPNSRIKLTPDDGGKTSLQQTIGTSLFKIDRRKQVHFEVNTPFLAAAVKGTQFSITVTPDDAEVTVIEGLVETRSNAGSAVTLLAKGMGAKVRGSAPGEIERTEKNGQLRKVTANESQLEITDQQQASRPRTGGETIVTLDGSGGSDDPGAGSGTDTSGRGSVSAGPGDASSISAPRLRNTLDAIGDTRDITVRIKDPDSKTADAEANMNDITGGDERQDTAAQSEQSTGLAARTVSDAASTAHRIASGKSFLQNNRVRVEADFPWVEVGYGALALVGLYILNHIFSLRRRSRSQGRSSASSSYY